MKKYNKHRTFFGNKNCDICKKPASLIRFYKNKSQVICSSKKCDYLSRVKLGIFKTYLNIK